MKLLNCNASRYLFIFADYINFNLLSIVKMTDSEHVALNESLFHFACALLRIARDTEPTENINRLSTQ